MKKYDPKTIEPKWQQVWSDTDLYKTPEDPGKQNYYALAMFPYPSGDLHTGHWWAFCPPDTFARFQRMRGYNVLHPMGFDAFGLPAENAAIQRNIPPADWTEQNTANMTRQFKLMGPMYDWDKVIDTSSPDYYRWTQWLFLELFENGLAYRAKGVQNWCPKDQTVLANEQVVGGVCERCGTKVTKKELEQWFFKITDYADRLLADLDQVEWPQRVKTMQQNWIGKSQGALIKFPLVEAEGAVEVFSTRIDTLFSATFLLLAPEHELVSKLTTADQKEAVENYVKEAASKIELDRLEEEGTEKTGVFTGSYVINPANDEKLPVWVADFVLGDYGTGAVFADAHDQRDSEFAKKYDLSLKTSLKPADGDDAKIKNLEEIFTADGILYNSGQFDGLTSAEARVKITEWLESKGLARPQVLYRIRDWLISRQRYWGAPIPIVYCPKCGVVPVAEDQLPVELPLDVEFEPTGKSPLADRPDFYETTCPKCDGAARRETDTMDTFVDSSWYYLRYPSPHYQEGPFDAEEIKRWLPVDQYMGGIEHAILHLLYARFITKALFDRKLVEFSEPFRKLYNQGIILGPDGQKMSKSRGNVVNPEDWVTKYGADTFRMYLMFIGPWDQGGPFDTHGIAGVYRFLNRVWDLIQSYLASTPISSLEDPGSKSELETRLVTVIQKTIKKGTDDLQVFGFNTAVAAMMETVNELYRIKAELSFEASEGVWRSALSDFLKLLAPFAPHLTEELWRQLGETESIHVQTWPIYDPALIKESIIPIIVQVNGKFKMTFEHSVEVADREHLESAAKAVAAKQLDGKEIINTIVVPRKLVNFVVK